MCGLLTYFSTVGDAAMRESAISDSIDSLHHRGPDETGSQADDDAVLAFKRLSIIDPRSSSQPMNYADRYVVVFNGEIYNYRQLRDELIRDYGAEFATDGDTEVLAAAWHYWGVAALRRLRGMFAFVIWDRVEKRAHGARDRFGIKPLYYLTTGTGVYFASEQKALLPFLDRQANVDSAALSHYLTYQYVPEPNALVEGITTLEAGRTFTFSVRSGVIIRRYWKPEFRPSATTDAEALYRRIRETLRGSVHAHMRADVPVGAFLSGGVDSTAVVAMAREVNPELLTFTATLEADGYSELDVAQASARALGVRNIAVPVTARMMMEALPRIVWQLDDPVADPALVPLYFVAMRARRDVTVVLSGEGADELFAGYRIYREPISLRVLTSLPARLRRGLRAVAAVLPQGVTGRGFLERGTTTIEDRYHGNARMFTEAEKRALLREYDPAVRYTDVTAPLYEQAQELGDVEKMQYIDLGTWLPGDILRKADRMSMANSLEVRVPFLDPEVFEVASTIPTRLKLPPRSTETKYALRRALAGVVPAEVAGRAKLGFPTPIRVWLRDEMYDWAAGILSTSDAGALVDLSQGLRLLQAHRTGRVDHSRRIWTILVFCVWYGVFVGRTIMPELAADAG